LRRFPEFEAARGSTMALACFMRPECDHTVVKETSV
jgi:hypothetical protein